MERALYQRAVGYSYDAEVTSIIDGKTVTTTERRHVPPDTTACIFWLKNRRKVQWRDKQEVEQHTTHSFEALIMRSFQVAPLTPAQLEAKIAALAGTEKKGQSHDEQHRA